MDFGQRARGRAVRPRGQRTDQAVPAPAATRNDGRRIPLLQSLRPRGRADHGRRGITRFGSARRLRSPADLSSGAPDVDPWDASCQELAGPGARRERPLAPAPRVRRGCETTSFRNPSRTFDVSASRVRPRPAIVEHAPPPIRSGGVENARSVARPRGSLQKSGSSQISSAGIRPLATIHRRVAARGHRVASKFFGIIACVKDRKLPSRTLSLCGRIGRLPG